MGVDFISDLDALEARFRYVDEGPDETERRRRMENFCYAPDRSIFARLDPLSAEYREEILRAYRILRGGWDYHLDTGERNPFDLAAFKVRPYPYLTNSNRMVGDHLTAIGLIVRDFPAPVPAKVLEFGPGCGHLSISLARTGYHVTTLDIEAHYIQLIEYMATLNHVTERMRNIKGRFSDVAQMEETFDVALFFESFHHVIDHNELLAALYEHLSPGGYVVFAGEPITDDFDIPWGLRTDSLSAYCIRRNGWMELGFQTRYFLDLMARHGFRVERRQYVDSSIASGFIAQRI